MLSNPAWRRTLVAACALFLVLGAVTAGAEENVVVRVFRLRFATPSNVSAAVQPLLSHDGTVTVQPGKRLVTVRDRADIVDRVGTVVARMDVEPSSFRLRVEMLSGFNSEVSLPEGPEVDPRVKSMFPFDAYKALGGAVLEGEVGDDVAVDLDEGYRVRVTVREHRVDDLPYGLPTKSLRYDLQPFVLERIRNGAVQEVLRTRVVLSVNQEVFIGAGETESSQRGFVLIVKALSEGSR